MGKNGMTFIWWFEIPKITSAIHTYNGISTMVVNPPAAAAFVAVS